MNVIVRMCDPVNIRMIGPVNLNNCNERDPFPPNIRCIIRSFFIYNRAFAHFIILLLLFFFNEIRPMVGISLLRILLRKKIRRCVRQFTHPVCLRSSVFFLFFRFFFFFFSSVRTTNNRDRQLIAVKNDIYPLWIICTV